MKKGFMECPYCANEIKEGAVKCQYCHEFLDGRDENSNEKTKLKKSNYKLSTKYIRIGIIGLITVIILIFGISKLTQKENWQGFYYEDELKDGKEIGGPIFNNYEACKDWAVDKFSKGHEAFCSYNCHDSVDGTPICEKAVRTRHPLPGFGEVFEGVDELRESMRINNEKECLAKSKSFENSVESGRKNYDAYHECETDVYYIDTIDACIGESACGAGGARFYTIEDLVTDEIIYSCSDPADEDCYDGLETIHNLFKTYQ